MKTFRGPRYQGGWIGLAIGAVGAIYKGMQQDKQNKQTQQDTTEQTNEKFQDSAWLAQQQRKFSLQDRQYEENAVRQYAPFYKGPAMPDPKLTSTDGLADWQPTVNGKGDIPILSSSYMYQQPGAGNG